MLLGEGQWVFSRAPHFLVRRQILEKSPLEKYSIKNGPAAERYAKELKPDVAKGSNRARLDILINKRLFRLEGQS